MDGSSRTIIVQGLTRLHWPNGLAIDEQTLRLFITDAYLDRIVSCGFNGQDFSIVYSQSFMIRHPYAIGVFGVSQLHLRLHTAYILVLLVYVAA